LAEPRLSDWWRYGHFEQSSTDDRSFLDACGLADLNAIIVTERGRALITPS
jgi:hypothetical protein